MGEVCWWCWWETIYIRTGSCREVLQTLDAAVAKGKGDFATNGCGTNACGGETCYRTSDLGDSEDPSTNLSDATRNAINKC